MILLRRLICLLCLTLSLAPLQAKAKTFHLVTATFKPFTDPDHPKGGFLVDIARQAFAKAGHDITITFHPWPRAIKEAETGRADGLLSAFYSPERAELFHFSAPLNTTRMVFIGLRSNIRTPYYNDLKDLAPYRIAAGRKWAYSPEFTTATDLKKEFVDNEEQGIHLLYNGRIDLFAVNIDQYRHTISKMNEYDIEKSLILTPPISINDHHIIVSRTLPDGLKLLTDFNTGLAALKASGDYQQTRKRFFGF